MHCKGSRPWITFPEPRSLDAQQTRLGQPGLLPNSSGKEVLLFILDNFFRTPFSLILGFKWSPFSPSPSVQSRISPFFLYFLLELLNLLLKKIKVERKNSSRIHLCLTVVVWAASLTKERSWCLIHRLVRFPGVWSAAAGLSAPYPCIDTWCPASPFGHSTASVAVPDPTAGQARWPSSTSRSGWASVAWSASYTSVALNCIPLPMMVEWGDKNQGCQKSSYIELRVLPSCHWSSLWVMVWLWWRVLIMRGFRDCMWWTCK